MPNTVPQTTTLEALEEKFALAAQKSHVNYSFFFGATNNNVALFDQLDEHRIPGIKLFMGSSTGNMLVDRRESLERIFSSARLPIMAHCEDTDIINRNMAEAKQKYGDDPEVTHHPEIRSAEACYESTRLAVELAQKHQARIHIAHLTTARELELIDKCSMFNVQCSMITAEATVSHLYFSDSDYATLDTRIKCNPAIKTAQDRAALRQALNDGRIAVIGTDHAPHLLSQKEGGCARAASGMPMIQFSLVTMLELVDDEFSRLRNELTEYRRHMQALVASGHLDEVLLDAESYRSYLKVHPFDRLNQRIASTNQAEIVHAPLLPFLTVFLQEFKFNTVGDVERFILENSDDAYQLAISQLALTDLDIISENVGLQNLCIVHILKNGGGRPGLRRFFDIINGAHHDNEPLVEMMMQQASTLPFM